MTDIFSGALDSIFAALGVEATFSGLTEPLIVIDKTGGTEVEMNGPAEMPTIAPALVIRAADVGDVGDLVQQTVTVNGATWRVVNYKPRPTPMGESKGEYLLVLRRV